MTLAARAEGLGSCWTGSFDNNGTKRLLGVSSGYQVVALTPLGYPEDPSVFSDRTQRNALSEIVCYERFE